jgi:hypothetical protein
MNVQALQKQKKAFATKPETIGQVSVSRPQTGKEYLESLKDGREVFIYGDRVADGELSHHLRPRGA